MGTRIFGKMSRERRDSYVLSEKTTSPNDTESKQTVTMVKSKLQTLKTSSSLSSNDDTSIQLTCLSPSNRNTIVSNFKSEERKSPYLGMRKIKIAPSSVHESGGTFVPILDSQIKDYLKGTDIHSRKINGEDLGKAPGGKKKNQILLFVALVFSLLGLSCYIICLGVADWMTTKDSTVGLWQFCIHDICGHYNKAPSELEAAQAMAVLGFLAGAVAVVLVIVYILVLKNKHVRLGAMICAFVAAGFTLIGVIVLGDFNQGVQDVGWAMIMCILGALIYIGVGAVIVLDIVKS